MTAILPNVDDAHRVDPNEFGTSWHPSNTNLALRSPLGGHVFEPLTALGWVKPVDKLLSARTYSIVGPFGHDVISGEATIEHCRNSKTEVVINPQDIQELLSGKAVVNGLGVIVDFYLEDVDEISGWELTVNAKHDWFDPRDEELKEFVITYHFGLLTPIEFDWPQIAVGAKMALHGYVLRKCPESGRFIVKQRNLVCQDPSNQCGIGVGTSGGNGHQNAIHIQQCSLLDLWPKGLSKSEIWERQQPSLS
ncbi:uncharacterized protein MELLADRAFT_114348 [Melampsora larici-populina 98AG31]|uniref:Uncharacterized protein n=1 Tax=Melampsora larici-populina (strain 98AG31 / pathotype 3-4-7) TaxID=747676 RepID=F4SD50_MELLP|nr:uncharacterized protein MELLADRAFT_114348 [Melampsora larici-populina 98AG31]EGF97430.1 hypothetical protein MELLADRAFT_114348 [Melampsora larici-populina 98AG31]